MCGVGVESLLRTTVNAGKSTSASTSASTSTLLFELELKRITTNSRLRSILHSQSLPHSHSLSHSHNNYSPFHFTDVHDHSYRQGRRRKQHRRGTRGELQSTNNNNDNDNDNDNNTEQEDSSATVTSNIIGLIVQPIVWISLYYVQNTGKGLPAGPGGSIGAIEGLSYLIVVVFALFPSLLSSLLSISATTITTTRITIVIGLLILIQLIIDQGCIPNAKPILDYSAYVPICTIPSSQ